MCFEVHTSDRQGTSLAQKSNLPQSRSNEKGDPHCIATSLITLIEAISHVVCDILLFVLLILASSHDSLNLFHCANRGPFQSQIEPPPIHTQSMWLFTREEDPSQTRTRTLSEDFGGPLKKRLREALKHSNLSLSGISFQWCCMDQYCRIRVSCSL